MMQSLQYFSPSIFYALTWPDLKKKFYLRELETFKHIIIEGREFRGGSDEKMRRMWLGVEIVVAGLPPLVEPSRRNWSVCAFNRNKSNLSDHRRRKYPYLSGWKCSTGIFECTMFSFNFPNEDISVIMISSPFKIKMFCPLDNCF